MRKTVSAVATASTALAMTALAVVTAPAANAIENNTVSGTASSSYQTNATVWAIATVKGVVYIGGDFTSVRPPGAALGQSEVARGHLAALNASTGALITSFNHSLNGSVRSLAVSPDGNTLYVGGQFTTVDGTTRTRLAAFNTGTGALTSWAPRADGTVMTIAPTATKVYVGGGFGKINNLANTHWMASLSATNGTPDPSFLPVINNVPYGIALSPDNSTLFLAGAFTETNGDTTRYAFSAVDAATGANAPFAAGPQVIQPSGSCIVQGKSVRADADGMYFSAEGTGGGCFDGTFSTHFDGTLRWVDRCLGATQGIQPLNGVLYTGSHTHDCSGNASWDPDAFPEVGWSRGLAHHLLSHSTADGRLLSWYPNTNGGTAPGQGPRVLATDGTQLFVGGEFTTVNGVGQQGFVRFAPGPDSVPARPATPMAVPLSATSVRVYVQAPLDLDDTDMTIRLFRDGGTTAIGTADVHSLFWRQPVVAFTDTGLATGSRHTYQADAVDIHGGTTGPRSPASAPITVTAVSAYGSAVRADDPALYYRLDGAASPIAPDSSDGQQGGTFGPSGLTFGQPGATGDGDRSVTFGGTSYGTYTTGAYLVDNVKLPSPTTFTVEAWFRTTTTSGGKIIGFGNSPGGYDFGGNTQGSSNYDKQIYMTDDGRLMFGVWVGYADVLTSQPGFNDGNWHHVVGTQGATGMALYLDGARVARDGQTANQSYDGYWRIGGDSLGAWPGQPSSNYFAGQIDDVAVYNHALTLRQVDAHYAASGRTPPPTGEPTDSYGKAVFTDEPMTYWRLDEASGPTASDASLNGNDGVYTGNVTYGVTGALGTQGSAVGFDGSTANVASALSSGGVSSYSLELWFSTTATTGGKLIGFGDQQTGASNSYDKQVYMLDDGRLAFGVYNNGFDLLYSAKAYNDGQWHHVVATQGPGGMALYVDDSLVATNGVTTNQGYTGYWRVGGDNLGWWPDRPSSDYFAGRIDEVAIYPMVLTAAQVDEHYVAAGRTGHDVVAPDVAITSPVDGATVNAGSGVVEVDATDAGGVASVSLEVDGTVVGTDTSAPYSLAWTAVEGSHTLVATAVDQAGNVGTSAAVHVTAVTPDTTPPTAPTGLQATGVAATSVELAWQAADDNRGVVGYRLYRDGALVASPTGLTATDSGLTPGTTYTYVVRAVDAAGNVSEPSDPVQVTTTSWLFQETFTAPDGSPWPAAWTTTAANGTVTVHSGTGQLAVQDIAYANARAQLTGLEAAADTDLTLSYQWNAATPTAYLSFYLRGSGGWQNSYRPRTGYGVQIQSNSGTVVIQKNVNGTMTTLQSVTGAQQVSTAKHWLRFQVQGSTVRFKIWTDGQAEPATWTGSVTDASITTAGQLFISLNRAGSNSGAKSVALDDVTIR